MKTINLKDYYAHVIEDTYIDIPDEVFDIFEEHRKAEQAYQSKVYYHKAYYSLDRGDGIEHSALFVSLSPDEIYERKLTNEQLHAAIATLPDKQGKRIYAHYFLGMGNLIKPGYVTAAFPTFLKRHGLRKIRFHDLRHSCASLLLANGVLMKQIQEWLGHSDFSTTANVYAHLDYNSKISSAAALAGGLKLE